MAAPMAIVMVSHSPRFGPISAVIYSYRRFVGSGKIYAIEKQYAYITFFTANNAVARRDLNLITNKSSGKFIHI